MSTAILERGAHTILQKIVLLATPRSIPPRVT